MIERSQEVNRAAAAFPYVEGDIDCEGIVAVVEDRPTKDPAAEKVGGRGDIPSPTGDGGGAPRIRERFVLGGDPKESSGRLTADRALECAGEDRRAANGLRTELYP